MFQKPPFRLIVGSILFAGILLLLTGCVKNKATVKDANYYLKAGNDCLRPEADNPDKAIDYFNKAIALDPKLAEAYDGRGTAYDYKHESDKAIADYDKAIALDPNDYEYYLARGIDYDIGKGDYDKAIADYDKAIALHPDPTYHDDAGKYRERAIKEKRKLPH